MRHADKWHTFDYLIKLNDQKYCAIWYTVSRSISANLCRQVTGLLSVRLGPAVVWSVDSVLDGVPWRGGWLSLRGLLGGGKLSPRGFSSETFNLEARKYTRVRKTNKIIIDTKWMSWTTLMNRMMFHCLIRLQLISPLSPYMSRHIDVFNHFYKKNSCL